MKVTKKDQAKDLYMKNHSLPRKQLIETFMKELRMSENSARTHISNVSREMNVALGKAYIQRNTIKPTLKREQAKTLVISNYATKSRKELASLLEAELGMSTNSAQTHISKLVKELGL